MGLWHRLIVLFAFLAVLFLSYCPSARAASPQDPEPPSVFRGYLTAKYVYRTVVLPDRRDKDQDIFSDLRLDLTPAREKGYEIHFLGSGRVDIDGPQKRAGFVPLEDIGNTYSRRSQGYIYEAHLDLDKPVPALSQVRLGRQTSTRDEPVIFDGMALDFGGDVAALSLYGGSAVHLFEIDHRWGHDTLQGAGLDLMPFSLTTLSLDVLAVKDEREFTSDDSTVRDRQFAIKLRQRIPPLTRLTAKYRTMNDEPRDLSVQAATTWQEAEAELAVNYFRQFRTQGELSNEFSLFFDVIGQSAPYQSYDVKARKFFAEKLAVDAGYFKRTLLDAGDKGPFDREFSRAYFDMEYSGCILAGLSCTVVTEWWQSGERKFSTGGLDLAYSLRRKNGKDAKIGAGTYYSLYKYDYYIDIGARELVRTYYLNGRYPFTASVSLNGSYEFEHGIENYQTVKTGIRYDF